MNALRGSMDAAESKHVVFGLLLLTYISDAFEAHHAKLEVERNEGADPEDPDECRAENIFWVSFEACWLHLQKNTRHPTIGQLVNHPTARAGGSRRREALVVIEQDNPSLKGGLSKDDARSTLDTTSRGQRWVFPLT